ncbi:MAG: NAD(P)H-hydrate dehydratase [Bacteriovoracaceae bacterium]|nr:NAD(P)H-hydrate dehydratase [Bacteriovoracaceae bacterium]
MVKLTKLQIRKKLPKRVKSSNKTDAGHTLMIAGGKNYLGAGIISALAATKVGSGYTHLMCESKKYPWLLCPDFILHPLKISILSKLADFSFGVGPGLGVNSFTKKVITTLIKNKREKVTLDADALTVLSQMKKIKIPSSWILTPHEGELARLLQTTSQVVKSDRMKSLKQAHFKYGCHILLKGAETLLIDHQGKVYCVNEGTVALAKAGMGDILTGLITGLRAQGLSPIDAMSVATFIHGRASREYLKKGNDILSLRPVDLIELIPRTIRKTRES